MELVKLSASRLKTYSSCAKKYWYEYVERVETPKHIAAIMGSAVHQTVHNYYSAAREGLEPVSPLVDYVRVWGEELKFSPDTQVDQKVFVDGMDIVQRYDFQRRVPLVTEFEFLLPFPDPIEPICEIHGFIDQLYDWGFVDLKTSKRKPAQVLLNNDLQFILYRWAFYSVTGESARQALWHHLRTGEDLQSNANPEKVDFATRVIERILESQERGTWDRNVGEACLFCQHRTPCLGD